MHRTSLLALLLPAAALAGPPGSGDPVTTVIVGAETDTDARLPIGLGGEVRLAIPLAESPDVPALELRASGLHTRQPPAEIEDFMKEVASEQGFTELPDKLAWSRWESRLQAMASWGATSREGGLRLRAGAVGVVAGSVGSTTQLEPIGWDANFTASLHLGPTAAVGLAVPFGDDLGDPLLDVRLGTSWALPVSTGGGTMSGPAVDREWTLTVDDRTYSSRALIGRESRAWVEAGLIWGQFTVQAELGLEHNAHSAITRARADSPDWDIILEPEAVQPHARLMLGVVF
jgi:hypothetical protein